MDSGSAVFSGVIYKMDEEGVSPLADGVDVFPMDLVSARFDLMGSG